MTTRKTMVGQIDHDVLAFTAGKDTELDLAIGEVDCIGTAAHVTMLSRMRGKKILSVKDRDRIIRELVAIIRQIRAGRFTIRAGDQDIHLAVERALTKKLGDAGKRVHTGRSRNDQVAVDLRLHGKTQMLAIMAAALDLSEVLTRLARRHEFVPMVGRTHLQPAMPSSVGLWASAHAESLLDDMTVLAAAYEVNNRSPLGSAAGYGVSLDIDRSCTSSLLGFSEPHLNVLYASCARGKCESAILSALSQTMISASRLAEDLILYSMPEFGYFVLPRNFGTGSSIMPQKNNPDVLELIRAKARKVSGYAGIVTSIVQGLASGYSRDLQESKQPYLEGLELTRASLDILVLLTGRVKVDRKKLLAGFTPEVFAADKALDQVGEGVPFREAYDRIKEQLSEMGAVDPREAVQKRFAPGASAAVDLNALVGLIGDWRDAVRMERRDYEKAIAKLLGKRYPALD